MRWWRNNVQAWAGRAFPVLIMQIVVSAGMVIVNGLGLALREFDPFRVWMLVGFGAFLVWWVVTLVGVLRLRAARRRNPGTEETHT